jgi:hypothetical protein
MGLASEVSKSQPLKLKELKNGILLLIACKSHHSAPNVLSKSVMFLVGINFRRMNPLTMQQDIAVMTPTTMNCWEG